MKKEKDLVEQLLEGREVVMPLETEIGTFQLKTILTPWDEVLIERGVALRCGEIPVTNFEKETLGFFRVLSTLAVVTEEAPSGWPGADNYPDVEFIRELYRGYLRLFNENKRPAKQSGSGSGDGKQEGQGPALGGGAFSGVAYGPKAGKPN